MTKSTQSSTKYRGVAYTFWLFFGWLGIHRFYLRKFRSGAIMMILGIGTMIYHKDLIMYIISSSLWLIIEGWDLSVTIPVILYYFVLPLSTSLVFIYIWWIIDAVLIYKYTATENQNKTKEFK